MNNYSQTMRKSRVRRYQAIAIRIAFLASLLVSAPGSAEPPAGTADILYIGHFSAADPADILPAGWEPLVFKKIERHSEYRLVDDGGTTVVQAKSDASASGLIRKITIDPRTYPIIEWRWKTMNTFEKGDVTRKSGDDYPARIYIAFEYDPDKVGFFERARFGAINLLYGEYPPIGAINYIWASHAPEGTTVPNAYTDRVKMIVVESGETHAGTWVTESRNLLEDYKTVFGDEPPMIRGIAIMTDSDNTGASAQTFYGDIVMKASR